MVAGIVGFFFGVEAENKSLEEIAKSEWRCFSFF